MAQVGVLSLSQLELHDHYDLNTGGPILEVTRAPSANIRILSAVQRVTVAGVGVWGRLKQVLIRQDTVGSMDLNYTLTRGGGAGTVHAQARIYRNGAAIWTGVDNATAAGPTIFTDAAIAQDLIYGDTLELWGYVSAGATTICVVEQLEYLWDSSITAVSRIDLTVALGITGAGILYTVNS